LFLDESVYRRVDNIIVPARDGTTQIDHVLVSVYGVFVVETKNLKGWIFGDRDQRQWTQVIFGKKFHFQNPLHQNYRHTKCLSEYLGLDHNLFRSVVFFISECEFKTEMPENVLNAHFKRYLNKFTQLCLSAQQVIDIESKLVALKAGRSITKAEHLHSLEVRHESATCPRCGGQLIERTAGRGTNAGNRFVGCANYPRCKYTRNI
jgi:predicted RNA-binding Zn-ribbon protein involved in translation (DUF1610 family)